MPFGLHILDVQIIDFALLHWYACLRQILQLVIMAYADFEEKYKTPSIK